MITKINIDYFPFSSETETIIGVGLEVHKYLGHGFLEIVYKDALEFEFRENNMFYEREKEFPVLYKGIVLKHRYYADFILLNTLIPEIKSKEQIAVEDYAKTINYLKCSGCKAGLILNFGREDA